MSRTDHAPNHSKQSPRFTAAPRVIPLTDFAQVGSLFSNWQGELDQLSCGSFRGTLRVFRGSLVRVVAIAGNQSILLRGPDSSNMIAVHPVTNGNAGGLWQGRRLAPGQMMIHGADAETDHRSARLTESVGLFISPKLLQQAARSLLGEEAADFPRAWSVRSLSPRAFAGLNFQMARLLNAASWVGGAEGDLLEQECVRSVVSALFGTGSPRFALPLPGRARLLRSAEELMRSRLGDPLGAMELCQALGVSDRTIRLAFRERYGLGPMAYYKCLRLNAARSQLKLSPAASIAEIAGAFGFHHLGNFAADYRRQFGERPSETRRTPASGSF